jgi:dTDP-4-dehydrorhamnose reductase
MKKVLITGSNGLLGQKLIYQLIGYPEYQVFATSKGENRTLVKKRYEYIPLDITDEEEVEETFSYVQPDLVINTAAMTNVDDCEVKKKKECWELNVQSVQYLASACEKYNSHLIHVSTDFIFDGKSGPYSEESEPKPLSYYGDSKLAAEQIVKDSSCKWSIVRTVLVYGVVDNMSRSNIVLWAKEALESGKEITVVDDQYRTPTLAEDLAHGCILIAKNEAEGIFNIAGDDYMCIIDLVKRVAKYYQLDKELVEPISSESLNQKAPRPPKTHLLLDKAKRELGYKPSSFEEGLGILDVQIYARQNEE